MTYKIGLPLYHVIHVTCAKSTNIGNTGMIHASVLCETFEGNFKLILLLLSNIYTLFI